MKRLIVFTLLLISIGNTELFSQDIKTIEGVKQSEFGRLLTISGENDEVEGYVFYSVVEKSKNGIKIIKVQNYDIDLNEVSSNKIEVTKHSVILSSAFNGQNLFLILGDPRKKTYKLVAYDKEGKKQGEKDWTLKKWSDVYAELYPSPTGSYLFRNVKDKKIGFEISHFNNSIKQEWKKKYTPEKGYEDWINANNIGDKIVFVKEYRPSNLSKKITLELITLNEKDGKLENRIKLFDGKNTYIPSAIKFDKEKNIVLGGMYFEGGKFKNTNSKGLFVMKANADGSGRKKKSLPWKGEMQEYLKMSKSKGLRIDAKNKIFFEDILVNEKGIHLIGETFSKSTVTLFQVSDITIGYKNTPDEKPSLFNIKDIMIFNFDSDLRFKNAQIIPKKEITISCFSPYNRMYGLKLSKKIKDLGYFNYKFPTKENPESATYNIISTNKGDFIDNYKKGIRYSITQVDPDKIELQQELKNISRYKEDSKLYYYGLLKNSGNRILVYYFDSKYDAVRLYLDDL